VTRNEKDKRGFPYLDELLEHYSRSFDAKQAKADGKIIPSPGINEEYDEAVEEIKSIENELNLYLKKQIKVFGCVSTYITIVQCWTV